MSSCDGHWAATRTLIQELFFFFFEKRSAEHLTRTCSDRVNSVPSLPRSNFQSSAMFEGSEAVKVEGGSAESTVAASISACKKVGCRSPIRLPPVLCLVTASFVSLFTWPYTCPSYLPPCQFIFSARGFNFLLRGCPVTPGDCAIRGTVEPWGQHSRFIISQCQRDRRGK